MPHSDPRLTLIHEWLSRELDLSPERLEPASSDASFRRYFRVLRPERSYVVMDAPPDKEDVRPYLHVSGLLEAIGVHVPHVHAAAVERGLLLLEDLGSTHLLSSLNAGGDANALYGDALRTLARIQAHGMDAAAQLPPYDRGPLARELALMAEWFLPRHLGVEPDASERALIDSSFDFLIRAALEQPTVFVHRDYHSRNLMILTERGPGVLDFQDALRGPVGYDPVSLLKDCYISWPRERVLGWLRDYRRLLSREGGPCGASEAEFVRWFDLIGLQRHIKVLGIFARLYYRDGKPGYLRDLPLTLAYVDDTAARYPELAEFSAWLRRRVVPELPRANARVLA